MRERHILFNGAMVRAILSGAKSQTRRVVKGMALDWLDNSKFTPRYVADPGNDMCPFGKIGDRLWVKETTVRVEEHGYIGPVYVASQEGQDVINWGLAPSPDDCTDVEPYEIKLRPSIHMPRSMCRLVLEITDVRVERLQALPESDWEAEGISFCMEDPDTAAGHAFNEAEHYAIAGVSMRGTPEDHGMRAQFAEQGLDWDANPWVWVIGFKVIDQQAKPEVQ